MAAPNERGQHRPGDDLRPALSEREESEVDAEHGGNRTLLVTAVGYEQLAKDLQKLRTNGRVEMGERLREAREDGHLANNPALYDLLEEQVRLERRIAILEGQLAQAEIAVPPADGAASVGSVVRVRDRKAGDVAEYELVGPIEANIANARVSIDAPVGRALLGQGAGAVVDVEVPSGTLGLKVLSVRTREPQPQRGEAAVGTRPGKGATRGDTDEAWAQ
jgi:transcription elongation factor GreA